MKYSAAIYNELKEISPFLAEMERVNVYAVPENYFEVFAEQILRTTNPLYSLPASEPHFSEVPEGYFESLPLNILNKIKSLESNGAEQISEMSPMLYSVQNKNVYSVPKGYFENFPSTIIKAVRPQAKVVAMTRRATIWKYARAAVVAGIVAVSALWVINNPSQNPAVTAGTKVNIIPSYFKDAVQYKNEQQIEDGIAKLDDEDIIKYLETTGNNSDDDFLATSVQDNDLPAEEDYLINDKALDIYLGNMEPKRNAN